MMETNGNWRPTKSAKYGVGTFCVFVLVVEQIDFVGELLQLYIATNRSKQATRSYVCNLVM